MDTSQKVDTASQKVHTASQILDTASQQIYTAPLPMNATVMTPECQKQPVLLMTDFASFCHTYFAGVAGAAAAAGLPEAAVRVVTKALQVRLAL